MRMVTKSGWMRVYRHNTVDLFKVTHMHNE